jgi:hypothetical protein
LCEARYPEGCLPLEFDQTRILASPSSPENSSIEFRGHYDDINIYRDLLLKSGWLHIYRGNCHSFIQLRLDVLDVKLAERKRRISRRAWSRGMQQLPIKHRLCEKPSNNGKIVAKTWVYPLPPQT